MLIFSTKRFESLDGLFSFFFMAMRIRKEMRRVNMEVNKDVGDRVQKIRESFASLFSLQRGETKARHGAEEDDFVMLHF